ncbi:unnamed protein product, partial [Scytosiphon promiscuus]
PYALPVRKPRALGVRARLTSYRGPRPMCPTKGDDGNSSTESSRTSSCSSDDDSSVESISSQVIPPPSCAGDTTSLAPSEPCTQAARVRKVALVALLFALAIAIGAVGSGSCWAGSCGADGSKSGGSGERRKAKLNTDLDVAAVREGEVRE